MRSGNEEFHLNENLIDRRNGLAVFEALCIYLDAMRPFLFKEMPVHAGTANQATQMKQSLPQEMRSEFDSMLVDNASEPFLPIDVKHVPHIVKDLWHPVFHQYFDDDAKNIDKMHYLAKVRNLVCHPGLSGLDANHAHRTFSTTVRLLRFIDRDDAAEGIESVRERWKAGAFDDGAGGHTRVDADQMQKLVKEVMRLEAIQKGLVDELMVLRERSHRPRRVSIASKLRSIVPRVRVNVSVGFGDRPETDAKSALHRPPEEVIPSLEPSPADSNGHLASADQTPDGRASTSQAVGKHL